MLTIVVKICLGVLAIVCTALFCIGGAIIAYDAVGAFLEDMRRE